MQLPKFILASISGTVNEPGGPVAKRSRPAFSLTGFNLDVVQFITSRNLRRGFPAFRQPWQNIIGI